MIDLPESMNISRSFNVFDLYEYCEEATLYPDDDLRTSSLQKGDTDVGEVVERFMEEWDRTNTRQKSKAGRFRTGIGQN